MITDAHCHPFDLVQFFGGTENSAGDGEAGVAELAVEAERRAAGAACAASAWNRQQFEYHQTLSAHARAEGAPPVFCCFALHPQLSAASADRAGFSPNAAPEPAPAPETTPEAGLALLHSLASSGQLSAVGETGFDLYSQEFRATEAAQDEFFARHLDAALQYRLPIVLHVRRALHKIFPYTRELKKLPAVVFHSWPGTAAEGEALVRRGINAFFSFGTTILNNHRAAMHCAARFPPDRILLETDAPYQPLRGTPFSSWRDLPQICAAIATLRTQAASPAATSEEVQSATTANFFRVFGE